MPDYLDDKEELLEVLTNLKKYCQEILKDLSKFQKKVENIKTEKDWNIFDNIYTLDFFSDAMYSLENCWEEMLIKKENND